MIALPSAQFSESVAANLAYWRQRTKDLSDDSLPDLDRDRQNLYRAAKYGLHLRATWRETAELILQAFVFIERRGYWAEWILLLERLLKSCPDNELALHGRLLDHLGIFYRHNRQLQKALATHRHELKVGTLLQDSWRQAHAHINLSAVCRQLRRYEEAETYIIHAQNEFEAIKAPIVKHAFVSLERGQLAQAQGHWPAAENYLSHSVSLWRTVNDPVYLANCLKLLGQVLAEQDKTDQALKVFQEALAELGPTENHLDKSRLLNELGSLHLNLGKFADALRLLSAADSSLLRRSGNLFDQAIIANNLGNVYQAQGQLPEAERSYQRSISLWQMCDDQVQLANALGGLAETKTAMGSINEAQEIYRQALALLADYPEDVWGQKLQRRYMAEKNDLELM